MKVFFLKFKKFLERSETKYAKIFFDAFAWVSDSVYNLDIFLILKMSFLYNQLNFFSLLKHPFKASLGTKKTFIYKKPLSANG